MANSDNPLLNKQVVKAFTDGVVETLTTMAKVSPVQGEAFIEKRHKLRGKVAGLIGMVSGDVKGQLAVCFDEDAAIGIVKNLINEEHKEIDDAVMDAIGELTNIIYGCAKKVLNENGFAFKMAIPMVIADHEAVISFHTGITLVVPYKLEGKNFYIEITIQK